MTVQIPELLLVDDERSTLAVLELLLTSTGFKVHAAGDGEQALELLQREPDRFDAVILDRCMPGMDGLEALRRIKHHPQLVSLPVIMLTSASTPGEVREGLQAGAFYYLTKPVDPPTLLAVVHTAVSDHSRYEELREDLRHSAHTLTMLEQARFRFRSPQEAQSLAEMLAWAFPDPDAAVLGLGELLVNAVEHGNLEIGYALKGHLLESRGLKAEVERRLADPLLGARSVTVDFLRRPGLLRITIRDEGPGFDWRSYLVSNPTRLLENHGRGIFMAHASGFTRLEYLGQGNEVVVEAALPA